MGGKTIATRIAKRGVKISPVNVTLYYGQCTRERAVVLLHCFQKANAFLKLSPAAADGRTRTDDGDGSLRREPTTAPPPGIVIRFVSRKSAGPVGTRRP